MNNTGAQVCAQPRPISAATRCCAVYGHPIGHSASPAMQNAGILELGLDWRYLAYDVHPEELPQAVAGAKAMGFIGLNLTVPHKRLALDLMDVLDESARAWGSVNTIRFEGRTQNGSFVPLGQLPPEAVQETRTQGFNTDAEALSQALREDLHFEIRGSRILLLGAGGAGHMAALKLAAEDAAELYVVNRTATKAATVAAEIKGRYPKVQVTIGYPGIPVDLILNATSLGLRSSDSSPLDEVRCSLNRAGAVFEMIYRPAETPLLRRAKAAGCRTANGLSMLLYQGAKALEIWSGRPAPFAVMRQALEEAI